MNIIESYYHGRKGFYIAGTEGNFAVKSCGNNRIIARDFKIIEEARNWLKTYYVGIKRYEQES